MRQKPESCANCACASHGTDFTRVDGTGSLGVLICAESSGEQEQREQVPLVRWAPAGSLLERTFTRMGLSRKQFSLTNCIRCRPRNNFLVGSPWEFSALNHCRPNLDAAIAERRPRCILTLGDVALRELTGLAGDARGVSHLSGYVLRGPNDIPVVPAFHPAFIRRGKAAYQGFFSRNLQRALNVASGKDRDWIWLDEITEPRSCACVHDGVAEPGCFLCNGTGVDELSKTVGKGPLDGRIRYSLHPSLDEARAFAARVSEHAGGCLSYDIETYESASLDEDARDGFTDTRIRLIQFSLGSGEAIALPWEGAYREVAASLLRNPITKCGHNAWLFDNKVLRAVGEREGLDLTPRGTIHDTLQMFHHWQPDLPAHLQFCAQFVQFPFPWKHLAATDIEFYGCVDVDATLRLYHFLESVLKRDRIWEGSWSADGFCDGGYVGQVQQVRPILAAMEDRGLPVDDRERLKLDGEFDLAQQELDQELQARVPESVLGLEPRRGKAGNYSYGYLRAPKDVSGLVERVFEEATVGDNGEPVLQRCTRWCRVVPFNPNSWQQLLTYMDAKGHKRPKSRKAENEDGSPKDTTEKKELIRLAQRHSDSFYLKVIEYRELSKMRGTYIEGFKPHADGCVHTTFTFDTGIGQLSSRNPNIQNFPKHGRLAKAVRRMIAAKPGYILADWDYKSCHILTLGFLAGDAAYIRCARIDMHSLVTGHKLKLWDLPTLLRTESDDQLRSRCKWLKSNPEWKHIRDARMKHAILGIGNGLKAKGLFEKHIEDFSGIKEAQQFLDVVEFLFPKVFEAHKRFQKMAHEDQMIRTQYGFLRRFYEVFRWDHKKHAWGHGDQAEESISYWLSNIAFGYIREHMKLLEAAGLNEKYGLVDNVHDALTFHFPEELLDEHIREVYPLLIQPSRVLRDPVTAPDGLYIDCELNVGKNWSEMEEVSIKGRINVDQRTNAPLAVSTAAASPSELPAG